MYARSFLTGLLLVGVALTAHAHAHLKQATPADHSVLTAAPPEVVLQLSEPARLTTVSIQREAGARQPLVAPKEPASEIHLALPALEPGSYVVSWRALSDDGHVTSGALHFKLAPHS
jgi:methionine-rich copper-binding protein CopC